MSLLDVESLLEPISAGNPAGELLEDDAAFRQLERAVQGKPEQQIGQTVVRKAEPPEWPAVRDQAADLLQRTKDLRVAVHWACALLHLDGFIGFARGLGLLRALLETYWPSVYPPLDVEDGDDPTARVNALAALSDSQQLLALRALPLVRSVAFGGVSLRQLESARAASGEGAADAKVLDGAALDAAFQEANLDEVQATADALRTSVEHLAAIEGAFDAAGPSHARATADLLGRSLGPVSELLQRASAIVDPRLEWRLGQAASPSDGQAGPALGGLGDGAGTGVRSGPVRSREDVLRAIEQICAYYAAYEPSSPVPLLLKRCKRLVNKDFMDIVKDLAPDALSQIETIAGKPEAETSET
ncbi:MAG TPA: type VI secretion system protein TssA [Polyangiaceae bacterium]